jgi:5-methylcytosine-specific restriction protein A
MTATARSVEWIGRTPDSRVPRHVAVRVYLAFNGICPKCTRKLVRGKWQCDHIVALINGGENRELNLQPLCTSPCHSGKTRADVAEKSRVYRKRAAHLGIRKPSRFPGSRDSKFKKCVDGRVVLRNA